MAAAVIFASIANCRDAAASFRRQKRRTTWSQTPLALSAPARFAGTALPEAALTGFGAVTMVRAFWPLYRRYGFGYCAWQNERRQADGSAGAAWRRYRQGAGEACPAAASGGRAGKPAAGTGPRLPHWHRARGGGCRGNRFGLGDRSMARHAALGDDRAVLSGGCRRHV